MVENLLNRLRKIDINHFAEKKLNEAREKKTLEDAETFLKENLDGETYDLAMAILKEEFECALEEFEEVGIFRKDLDDESAPFSDDPLLIKYVLEECLYKTREQAKFIMQKLNVSKEGVNYVLKEMKKAKRDAYKKENDSLERTL